MTPAPVCRPARYAPLALSCLALASTPTLAATNNFVVPHFRGGTEAESGYWESFSIPFGAPGNSPDQSGSNTGAVLTQTLSPAAIVTGSGNIYNPAAPMAFTLADATPFTLGTVVLQVRTLGSELDYDGVRLTYDSGAGPLSLAPVALLELDRGTILGASVSALWQWDLRGLDITEYSLTFGTEGSSLSLDSVTLDTWSGFSLIPEPSGATLLALGSLVLLASLRRRS